MNLKGKHLLNRKQTSQVLGLCEKTCRQFAFQILREYPMGVRGISYNKAEVFDFVEFVGEDPDEAEHITDEQRAQRARWAVRLAKSKTAQRAQWAPRLAAYGTE